jgi:hypothetical protein
LEGIALLLVLLFMAMVAVWWLLRAFRTVRTITSVVRTVTAPDIFSGFSREETARLMQEVEAITRAEAPDDTIAPILESAEFGDPLSVNQISDASRRIYSLAIDSLQARLTHTPADRALSMKLSLLKARLNDLL